MTSDAAPVRVLLLLKGLGRGGAERLVVNGLPYHDRSRTQLEVAYVLPVKDALVPEVRAHGVPVHCLGREGGEVLGWGRALHRLVRSKRFDVIHTHMPLPAMIARSLFPRSPPAFVHTEHNVWPRYKPLTRVGNALTYRRNSVVFAVSEAVARSIWPRLRTGGKRPHIEVLVHGVDHAAVRRGPAARDEARARLGLDDQGAIIGHVGNLTAKKDQRSLLSALSLLVDDLPNVTLVMIGLGPLEPALRRHADDLGVTSKVVWAGSRDDVLELMPAFDLFVLSSVHEGLPIALLEAMATGLPCVATRAGGITEVVTDGEDGLLVPPGQTERLAAAMRRVLRDPQLSAGLSAGATATAERFDIRRAVERLDRAYDDVVRAIAEPDHRQPSLGPL